MIPEIWFQARAFLRQLAELHLHLHVKCLEAEARILGMEIYQK